MPIGALSDFADIAFASHRTDAFHSEYGWGDEKDYSIRFEFVRKQGADGTVGVQLLHVTVKLDPGYICDELGSGGAPTAR